MDMQSYIADCLIKITLIYHCVFIVFAFKHYFTFIQPSSLVLPLRPVVTVTVFCSHFKAKLSAGMTFFRFYSSRCLCFSPCDKQLPLTDPGRHTAA